MELTGGVSLRSTHTPLLERASRLLAAGPASSAEIVAHACSLPAPPPELAERLAAAIFAGRDEFVRRDDGTWAFENAPARSVAGSPEGDAVARLSFAVVDVETTGTRAYAGDRITEFAAVVVRDGAIAESFQTLVNPERSIPEFITRLTNISWDMVKDAPTFADVAPRVAETLSGHVFVAHNAAFDWRFICAEMARATGSTLAGRRLCTVRLARGLLPQLPRRSLDHVARYYGVCIEGRHRAGGDALATARCLLRLLDEAASRGFASWHEIEHVGRRATPRRMKRSALPVAVTRDTTA